MYKITVVKSYVLSHIIMNEYKHLKYCERTQNYNLKKYILYNNNKTQTTLTFNDTPK